VLDECHHDRVHGKGLADLFFRRLLLLSGGLLGPQADGYVALRYHNNKLVNGAKDLKPGSNEVRASFVLHGRHHGYEGMIFEESVIRSTVKTVSWRIAASVTTVLLAYALTRRTDVAITVWRVEAAAKAGLFSPRTTLEPTRRWTPIVPKPFRRHPRNSVDITEGKKRITKTLTYPDTRELEEFGRTLEAATPLATLQWALDQFGPRLTFATGFGAEGCVLIDLIGRYRLPIDIFTLDTGLLFPETYELWQRFEQRHELSIRGVQPELSVDEQAATHGPDLWTRQADRCCQMRKVEPLLAKLSGFDAWITAVRRDQSENRGQILAVEWDPKFNLVKVNPLIRWTKLGVWFRLLRHNVPYNALYGRGYPSIGCRPCTSAVVKGEDDRAGRWRGIAKSEYGIHTQMGTTQKIGGPDPDT